MSGASSRRKGASAEREIFSRLNSALGREIFARNLVQSRAGGADNEGDLPVSIEVKRQEKLAIASWLKQAVEAAGNKPAVLAYRRSRESWKFLVEMTERDFVRYFQWLESERDTRELAARRARDAERRLDDAILEVWHE